MITSTYRAAFWISGDGQAEVVLTSPEESHLPDDDLMLAAKLAAKNDAVDLSSGRVEIGEWAE
ncbi:MAG: hypothetical protein O7A04_03450 [Acidobacteria bacterium]|nr:hypothetical protein [Acidobacteriota bacterium]